MIVVMNTQKSGVKNIFVSIFKEVFLQSLLKSFLKYFFSICLLLSFIASEASAQIKEFSVDKYKLKNGLTVLLHQDKSLPIYSLHLWYDVGSSDENPNRTGLAHFFEHLMFKGTKANKEGVYDDAIENNGGNNNAFTTRDYTGYYVEMPAGTLDLVLKLEADRMSNLEFTEDKIKREREVVKEERRMRVENSPFGLAFESLFFNAYTQSPYKWSVIGSMKHLENTSLSDFESFYKQYYVPNNAVLVLVGDFRKGKAKKWIEKYFGPLKAKKISRRTDGKEVYAKGGRHVKIKKSVQSRILATSLPGVSVFKKEAYELDILAMILASGKSSRLHKELVEKKKYLLSVSQWNFTPMGKGLLLFFNRLRPGVSVSKVKNAFKAVLTKTAKKGVTLKELNTAKKQIKLSSVDSYKTLSGKARGLALNELMFKDYKRMFTDVQRYQKISLEDVNRAAKKYLVLDRLNIIEVGK